MAEDLANNLTYLLEIDIAHKSFLGQIRHWRNLKVATESSTIWVKDFTNVQLQSVEFRSIPFGKVYVCQDNLLFPAGSLVPQKKVPNLLWTPIERALPISLPNLNHNFFGVQQSIKIRLIPSVQEQIAKVMFATSQEVGLYVCKASSIRLRHLRWVQVDVDYVLVFGEPLLPIPGSCYWQVDDYLLPIGYQFEFPSLAKLVSAQISPKSSNWIWWRSEQSFSLVDKSAIQPLSVGSWKQTYNID